MLELLSHFTGLVLLANAVAALILLASWLRSGAVHARSGS
jgi:hypothetical protein